MENLFSDVTAKLHRLKAGMATLRQTNADGQTYEVPLHEGWGPLPGRAGVSVYHVPRRDGSPGLHQTAFETAPAAAYTAGSITQSRLVLVGHGRLTCNGQVLTPGSWIWLAPDELTTWQSDEGARGVVYYDAPNPLELTP